MKDPKGSGLLGKQNMTMEHSTLPHLHPLLPLGTSHEPRRGGLAKRQIERMVIKTKKPVLLLRLKGHSLFQPTDFGQNCPWAKLPQEEINR